LRGGAFEVLKTVGLSLTDKRLARDDDILELASVLKLDHVASALALQSLLQGLDAFVYGVDASYFVGIFEEEPEAFPRAEFIVDYKQPVF